MVGDQLEELVAALAGQLLQPRRVLSVGAGAARLGEAGVGDVADQRVLELELGLAAERRGRPRHHQAAVLQPQQRAVDDRAGVSSRRTSSSRKKGLPSAMRTIPSHSAAGSSAAGRMPESSLVACCSGSGWSETAVVPSRPAAKPGWVSASSGRAVATTSSGPSTRVASRGRRELQVLGRPFPLCGLGGRPQDAFPDFGIELTGGFVAGDRAAMEWVMSGTHARGLAGVPATGRRVLVRGATVLELRDGRVTHSRDYWDTATLLARMG